MIKLPVSQFVKLVVASISVMAASATLQADSISIASPPLNVTAGNTYAITVNYTATPDAIVQLQLLDSAWSQKYQNWVNVTAGTSSRQFSATIPAATPAGSGYIWQAILYTNAWVKITNQTVYNVVVAAAPDSITVPAVPVSLMVGSTYQITANYKSTPDAIVQIQLFDSAWKRICQDWRNVPAGVGSQQISLTIPEGTTPGNAYIWQAILYTRSWVKITQQVVYNVTVVGSGEDWQPPGIWSLEWSDEFEGSGAITKWYPFLGYTPTDFINNTTKGIRWNGSTENTAQMYSTKTGNHWLNGSGQMVIQIVNDKTQSNANGTKVNAAYLLTGYPANWDNTEPTGVKWAGKFVSPNTAPRYICARVRTDKMLGHSTWFAFWLFTETRAYNGVPSNGTEVDVIEIAKGAPNYMLKSFNVANHWAQSGGSESQQFSAGSNPSSTSFVDVTDANYHVYGIEWTTTSMKCYVDGKLYKTFTSNIPSDPVDMMMLLTLEYQKNAWDPNQGDGRTSGPFVSDNSTTRVMSQVLIDYVRVYKK